MQNNRTKHKILSLVGEEISLNNFFRDTFIKEDTIYLKFKGKREDSRMKKLFEPSLSYLILDKYLDFKLADDGVQKEICLNEKGNMALSDNYFLNRNYDSAKDLILMGCNILVAIAAIFALMENGFSQKDEMLKLKSRVDSIEIKNKADTIIFFLPNLLQYKE